MPVYRKKLSKGKISWHYSFPLAGVTPRKLTKEGGFKTKGEAADAEAARRLKQNEVTKKLPGVLPVSLADVLVKWLASCSGLSPKTLGK